MRLDCLSITDILKLPSASISMRWQMPHIPVIYFVIKQPDLVLYIGQSKNLYNRFQRHDQLKNFRRHYDEFEEVENHPKVFYLDCSGLSDEQRIYHEYYYIGKLNPIYNQTGTLKNDIQNYTYNFFKILSNLALVFSKEDIINFINRYAYGVPTERNPFTGLALANNVKLVDYEVTRKNDYIVYEFKFDISEIIDIVLFKEIFTHTIIQNYDLPKDFCEKEKLSILPCLTISAVQS